MWKECLDGDGNKEWGDGKREWGIWGFKVAWVLFTPCAILDIVCMLSLLLCAQSPTCEKTPNSVRKGMLKCSLLKAQSIAEGHSTTLPDASMRYASRLSVDLQSQTPPCPGPPASHISSILLSCNCVPAWIASLSVSHTSPHLTLLISWLSLIARIMV
jgi:hypothetical protein